MHTMRKSFLYLTGIIIAMIILVVMVAVVNLYPTALEQERVRLVQIVKSQARLIEAVARFDIKHSEHDHPHGAFGATISQIKDASQHFEGFGRTGEFTFAQLQDDTIVFINKQRFDRNIKGAFIDMMEVTMNSPVAQPMQKALSGLSGTMVGIDYRGSEVLAAYESVDWPGHKVGIVAKVDIAEIKEPFLRAIIISIFVTFLVAGIGMFFFQRISEKVIKKYEDSEKKYRLQIETSNDAILVADETGTILDVNQKACELFGYPESRLIGMSQRELHPIDQREEGARLFQEHIRAGKSLAENVEIVDSTGNIIPVDISANVFTHEGKTLMQGVFRDVRERKHIERILKLTGFTIDNARDSIIWINQDASVFNMNETARKTLGYDREEFLSKNVFEFNESVTPEKWEEHWDILRSNGSMVLDATYRTKEGKHIPVEVSENLILFEGREYDCVFVRDVTFRKEAEQRLKESEREYHDLYRNSPDMLFSINVDSRSIFKFNRTFQKVTGYQEEDVRGRDIFEFYHPDSREKARDYYQKAVSKGNIEQVELVAIKKDGSLFHVSLNQSLVYGDDYQIRYILSSWRDITNDKTLEAALARQYERNLLLLESTGTAIFGIDLEDSCTFVNDACREMLGYEEKGDLLGKNIYQTLLRPDEDDSGDAEPAGKISKAYVEGREVFDDSELFRRQDGTRFPVEYRSFPVYEGGNITGAVVSFFDITERKNLLKKYDDVIHELRGFLNIISHDLRSPLVNIKGFSKELMNSFESVSAIMKGIEGNLPEEDVSTFDRIMHEDIPQALQFIDSSATSIDRIVANILLLSRLGKKKLNLAEVDSGRLFKRVMDKYSRQIRERNIEITVGNMPTLVADEATLTEILDRLLANSINYLQPERPGVIEVFAEKKTGFTVFSVRDNGCGIAEHNRFKVFELFRRAGRHTVPGDGFSLSYVKGMLSLYGGEIWFDSSEGEGSIFSFSLPDQKLWEEGV